MGLQNNASLKAYAQKYNEQLARRREELVKEEAEDIQVMYSPIANKGLFSKKHFSPGEIISHYPTGPFEDLRTTNEAGKDPEFANVCIQVGSDANDHALYLGVPDDNPRGFINHSCEPNAGIRVVDTNIINGEKDYQVIAIHSISPEEEITIDYSTTQLEAWTMECRCGKPTCRHVITEFTRLPRALQERYIDLGIVPDFIVAASHALALPPAQCRKTRK